MTTQPLSACCNAPLEKTQYKINHINVCSRCFKKCDIATPVLSDDGIPDLSSCCKAQIKVYNGREGTSFNTCSQCSKPCDLYNPFHTSPTPKEDSDIATPEQVSSNVGQLDIPDTEEWERRFYDKFCHPNKLLGETFTFWAKSEPEDVVRFIAQLIATERENEEKAYSGCRNCYGKGYATYRYGYKASADMQGDKEYVDPITTHMNFCSCDRGKQLKELVTSEREEIYQLTKYSLETFMWDADKDVFENRQALNKEVFNAIREKIRNNI